MAQSIIKGDKGVSIKAGDDITMTAVSVISKGHVSLDAKDDIALLAGLNRESSYQTSKEMFARLVMAHWHHDSLLSLNLSIWGSQTAAVTKRKPRLGPFIRRQQTLMKGERASDSDLQPTFTVRGQAVEVQSDSRSKRS